MHRSWILGVATLFIATSVGGTFAQPNPAGDQPIVPNPNARPAETPSPEPTPGSSPAAESAAKPDAAKGGLLIADTGNHRIVFIDNMEGENPKVLGRPGHGAGFFLHPTQVWVDPLGKIFVADRDNDRIIRMEQMNGLGWTEMAGFKRPEGVASRGDEIYVADTGNNQVVVYGEMKGQPLRTYNDPRLQRPTRLWLDQNKDLYVTCGQDPPGGRVVKISEPADKSGTKYEVYEGNNLRQLGFSPAGMVTWKRQFWMVCPVSSRLIRIDNFQGRSAREWGGYGAALGKFRSPSGLGLSQDGKLYVADSGNDRIVQVNGLDPKDWKSFAGGKDQVGLRSPESVFSWCPVPAPPPPPDPEDEKDKKDKDK
jgi:DNA-binding beta-propeller fold protein YncE